MANPYGYDEESVFRRGAPRPSGVAGMRFNLAEAASRGLGDPERSYGGGRLNEAAVQTAEAVRAKARGEMNLANLPKDEYGNTIIGRSTDQLGREILHKAVPGADLPAAARSVLEAGQGIVRPIHIIRGVTSTYAGGAPGEEFTSLSRAAQAINRFLGAGEYVSPEVAKAEALALRDPRKMAEAEAIEGARAQQLFERKLLGEFGVPDKEDPTKLVLPGHVQKLAYRTMPTKVAEVDKAIASIKPHIEVEEKLQLFNDPAKSKAMRESILAGYLKEMRDLGQPADPKIVDLIRHTPVTRQNVDWFTQRYQAGKKEGVAVPPITTRPGAPAPTTRPGAPEAVPEMRVFGEPSLNMPTETPGGRLIGDIARGIQARREALGFSRPAREREERYNLSRIIPRAM
ncbi:MAG: hypothetical protein AB1491_00040 [Thermodesulfobacteriota bacterium]